MGDIFDQIASSIDQEPSSQGVTEAYSAGGDIFDNIAAKYSQDDGTENSYMSRLFSTLFSKEGLKEDLYQGTIGSVKSMGSALNKAYEDVNNPNSDLPWYLKREEGGLLDSITPTNPVKTLGATVYNFYKDKTPVQQVYDTGKVAASFVPVVGPLLYDKAQQYVNPDIIPETTPEQDARALRTNALGTAAGYGLFKGSGKVSKALGETLDDAATATREKALGIGYGERKAGLGDKAAYLDEDGSFVTSKLDKTGEPIPVQIDDVTSGIQQKMKTLEESGWLKNAPNDPSKRQASLKEYNIETQGKIGDLIEQADSVVGNRSYIPAWERAKEYLASLRKSERELLEPELAKIKSDYMADPQTGLQKIITVKGQLADDAKFASGVAPKKAELYQRAYVDLQKLGEEVFDNALPEAAGTFSKTNQLASAQAELLRSSKNVTARDNPGILKTLVTPTGSGPFVGAAGLGSLVAPQLALPAAALGWVGRATYQGLKNKKPITFSNIQQGLGDIASATGEAASGAAKAVSPMVNLSTSFDRPREDIPRAREGFSYDSRDFDTGQSDLQITSEASSQTNGSSNKSTQTPISNIDLSSFQNSATTSDATQGDNVFNAVFTKPDTSKNGNGSVMDAVFTRNNNDMAQLPPEEVKQVELQIDSDPIDSAIYEVESGRNPLAKNPNSSASGGFQLIKQTARNLGVSDPFNLRENYEGYKKLRAETEARFKTQDPAIIYAAHFLGAPLLEKVLNDAPLTAQEQEQVNFLKTHAMPRFERAYMKKVNTGSEQI